MSNNKSNHSLVKDLLNSLMYVKYEDFDKKRYEKVSKVTELVLKVIADAECMAAHRRISDTDASYVATIDTLKSALLKKDEQIKELKSQLHIATANNRERNREMDALHYVWCNGGCEGGVSRYVGEEITEDIVKSAERNTSRLRTWFNSFKSKKSRET